MQQEDLKQIKEIVTDAISVALLENNKIIEAKIDEKIDAFALVTKESFDNVFERLDGIDNRLDGIDNRLDGIDGRLDKVEDRLTNVENLNQNIYSRMVDSTDNQLRDVQLDNDKIKFLHIDEWKSLPSNNEISTRLIEEGLKSEATA